MTETTTGSLRVPEGTRLLHIGSPKTGSTALQAAMHDRREDMRRHGVLLVGSDQPAREAVLAALMDEDFAEDTQPRRFRRWRALVEEVDHAADPRVCLSNESMSRVEAATAHAVVAALGGGRAHVVAVARRLDRLLPSQWQEWVRVGTTALSYERWLEVVLGDHPDDPQWRDFWLPHDLERLVGRWVRAAAPDRFSLLVADESDPRMLSRVFEQMLGLPEGLLRPEDSHRRNPSASMPRVETVRRINEVLAQRDWPAEMTASLRSRVAKRIRSAAPWPGEAPIPPLPAWAAERVGELDEQRERLLRSLDVRVVGDPADLRSAGPDAAASDVSSDESPDPAQVTAQDTAQDAVQDTVSTELAVQSVVSAIGGAVKLVEQERVRNKRTLARLRRRVRRGGAAPGRRSVDELTARDLLLELRRRAARRLTGRG